MVREIIVYTASREHEGERNKETGENNVVRVVGLFAHNGNGQVTKDGEGIFEN